MRIPGEYLSSGTGLALAPMLFASVAFNLVPSINSDIPRFVISSEYGDYGDMNPSRSYVRDATQHEIAQLKLLASFASDLSKSIKDLEPEMAKILNDNLWDIYDRF